MILELGPMVTAPPLNTLPCSYTISNKYKPIAGENRRLIA
jgi:hypothetical protein